MAQPLSRSLRDWKAAESRPDPLVVLYDVEVSDSLTLHYVEGNPNGTGSLVYQGNTYQAATIVREQLEQSIEGDVPTFRVAVSNIDGIPGGLIETYDLDGRQVTITKVLLSTLSPTDALVETYTIQNQEYNRGKAIFTLGHANLFKQRVPFRQFLRNKCQWAYQSRFLKETECGYPSDFFGPDSRQSFTAGARSDAEQERKHGWFTLNAASVDLWDVDESVPDAMVCTSEGGKQVWQEGMASAPFAFKKFFGDFALRSQVEIPDAQIGCMVGILCQSSAVHETWIFLGRAERSDQGFAHRVISAQYDDGDPSVIDAASPDDSYLRLERSGDVFTSYRSADNDNWTLIDTRTVPMSAAVRVGLCVAAGSVEPSTTTGVFRFFRATDGGLPTCERTLDDCRLHGNTRRFFAFRGIPRR
jgi:phage-related protein/regulation of enolase protein 1 (concanavalin A-like superfamily)